MVSNKLICIKFGFPLAEERKKRKTFFSHAAGSLGTGVRGGFQVTWLMRVSVFVSPSAID